MQKKNFTKRKTALQKHLFWEWSCNTHYLYSQLRSSRWLALVTVWGKFLHDVSPPCVPGMWVVAVAATHKSKQSWLH